MPKQTSQNKTGKPAAPDKVCDVEMDFDVRIAGEADIPELVRLYASIQITQDLYRDAFSPDSKTNFAKRGGMFIVHDAGSLRTEIAQKDSTFYVIRNPEGHIASMLWLSTQNPHFSPLPKSLTDFAQREADAGQNRLLRALEQNTYLFDREYIVAARAESQKDLHYNSRAGRKLQYEVFRQYCAKGYTHAFGEVYRVVSCSNEEGTREINMCNDASMKSLLKAGWRAAGEAGLQIVPIAGGSATVSVIPIIVVFDFASLT